MTDSTQQARAAVTPDAIEAAVSVAAKALFAEEEYGSEDRPDIDEKWLNFLSLTDREQYLRMARSALDAAAPYLLARGWDEGEQAGAMNHAAEEYPEVKDITNPYRSQA